MGRTLTHPCPTTPAPNARVSSGLTPGHHDVGDLHGGLDVLLEGRLHKLVVLLDDPCNIAPALHDVALQPPHQTDVGVRVHKHFHVQELENWEG